MDKKDKINPMFVIVSLFIIFGLILLIIIFLVLNKDKKSITSQNISLNNNSVKSNNDIFEDKICGISFKIPDNWIKSSTKLPLPKTPLAQTVFDENDKKSIFSYICFDDKYTFSQFTGDAPNLKTEGVKIGNNDFTRVGNFIYFNKNNKLIIFQMFFTKNDIKPESSYEEKLVKILESVK